jgi:hypothetical protein
VHVGAVASRVDGDQELPGVALRSGAREDAHRFSGGELSIETSGRDPDPLLAARLPQLVKLGTVEQLGEDARHLSDRDARTVVLDRDPEHVIARLPDLDRYVRENARFLASVEGVVDGFFDRGHQRSLRGVEAEQVTVLGEELGYGDRAGCRRVTICGARSIVHLRVITFCTARARPTYPPQPAR